MGFIAPAIPWIVKGAGMLGGALMSRGAQKSAGKRSGEESAALTGAQTAASSLQKTGAGLLEQGRGPLTEATNYYGTLLRGNRGAQAQATAAPAGAIRDLYAGAERGLEREGRAATSGARAELQREKVGKLASLVSGVQPMAAEGLSRIGAITTGAGAAATGQAGSIYANLLGQGAAKQQQARAEGHDAGATAGRFIFDILSGFGGKSGGGGGGGGGSNPLAKWGA